MALSLAFASAASADPAENIAASRCGAPAPPIGAHFSGPVLQVLDGQRLCIAAGPTPDQWIEVRPTGLLKAAQAAAAQDRSVLMTAAFSKRLDCIAGPRVGDAVEAACTVEGTALADEVEAASSGPRWRLWR